MTSSEKGAAPLKLKRSDYRVLRSLNEDARKSHRTIARELSLSRKTVSKSIKFLEESGVILGYAPVIDAARIGY
jgi:Lrp/AsnC family leucine-responsive transcriptional regulator